MADAHPRDGRNCRHCVEHAETLSALRSIVHLLDNPYEPGAPTPHATATAAITEALNEIARLHRG